MFICPFHWIGKILKCIPKSGNLKKQWQRNSVFCDFPKNFSFGTPGSPKPLSHPLSIRLVAKKDPFMLMLSHGMKYVQGQNWQWQCVRTWSRTFHENQFYAPPPNQILVLKTWVCLLLWKKLCNVWCNKNQTKQSSVLLLPLGWFLLHQTLVSNNLNIFRFGIWKKNEFHTLEQLWLRQF